MDLRRTVTSGALVVLLGMLCVAGSVRAHPPTSGPNPPGDVRVSGDTALLLQYQGRLTDPATGEPVSDGSHTMIFRLYDVESGGSELWSEMKDVPVQGGVFSTALGDGTALDPNLFNGQALWLGIKVGTDSEAAPRQSLLPVAYALGLVPGAQISTSSNAAALGVSNAGSGDALQIDGATTVNGDLSVSGSLSGASHAHSGDDITSGTVAEGRIDASIARDSEIMPTVLANDGAGSGLDADRLDGQQASAFADASHTHWGESWAGSGTGLTLRSYDHDGVFINLPGEDGVHIFQPQQFGIYVYEPTRSGFYVDYPGTTGLSVMRSDSDGVYIYGAGRYGVYVEASDGDGLSVNTPGDDGVHVLDASGDGLRVDGAGLNGLEIWDATYDGVQVNSAGRYGVQANTDGTYGFYTPDKIFAGAGYDDIAEHIDAAGQVEAGDVVVIDPYHDERVLRSTVPYDPAVAGVISTDPALLIGDSETETPLALAGRVPCKVSAENGSVRRGDLLTTSATPGHAMLATDPAPGTILGKAMGELESGTGVIPILVTLQ